MLKIHFGEIESDKYIINPESCFNSINEDKWMTDPLTIEMIKDIDGSEVKEPVSPECLSGSVKTLILIQHDAEHIYNTSACDDNCAKWLLKIGKEKDVLIRLGYLMDFGDEPFEIFIENLGVVVHDKKELYETVFKHELL